MYVITYNAPEQFGLWLRSVERANPAARRILGIAPSENGNVIWAPPMQLKEPLEQVLGGRADYLPTGLDHSVCLRDDGQVRFAVDDEPQRHPHELVVVDDDDSYRFPLAVHSCSLFVVVPWPG